MSRSFLIIVIGLVGLVGCKEEEGPPMFAKQEAPRYNVPQQVNLQTMGGVTGTNHLETVRERMRRVKAGRPVFTGNPGPVESMVVPVVDSHLHQIDPIDRPTFLEYMHLPKYEEWRKAYSWLAYMEWQRQHWTRHHLPTVGVHLAVPERNPLPPLVPFRGTVTTHVCDPTGPVIPFPDPAIWSADYPLRYTGEKQGALDPMNLLGPKPHAEVEGYRTHFFRRIGGRWIVQ